MAQATLNATVVLGGKVDNSFTQMGDALYSVGSMVNGFSQQLINFGKESIETYRNYEDNLLATEGSLSTIYGRNTRELHNVMTQLDMQLTEWAATTKFHTDDLSNAASEAANAGWDLDQMLEGLPAAMNLAYAGGLDLSTALGYILTSSKAAGISFGDMNQFLDEWAYSAKSVYGDIDQFGQAIDRMGATAKLAGTKEDLLSMLAILHENGTQGAEAGTLLRNALLRILAPTDTAKEKMKALGVTQEELDEAMASGEGNLTAAMQRLNEFGFSAYDASGKAKGAVEIFTDLAAALGRMTEQEQNDILKTLFGTKGITGGMAAVNELSDGIYDLNENLKNGEAEGYTQYLSDLMMSGVSGSIETLSSKIEKLKQVTGGTLAEDVKTFSGALGQMVDFVSGMDESWFNAIVGGAEVLAAAGPGLMTAGMGFKLIGTAWGALQSLPGGEAIMPIVLAAVAVGALANAIEKYNAVEFKDQFGNLTLDPAPFQEYMNGITGSFDAATADMRDFSDAAQEAIDKYTELSGQLSSDLITSMITEQEIGEGDQKRLLGLGESMYEAVKTGIGNAYDADAEAALQLFGGNTEDAGFQGLLGILEQGYGEAIERASTLSEQLREAMRSAFSDGVLSEDELSNVRQYMEQLNEVLATETEANNYAATQRMMRKAQTMGLDSAEEIVGMFTEGRDNQIADINEMRDRLLYRLDKSYKSGLIDEQTYNEQVSNVSSGALQQQRQVERDIDTAIGRAFGELISGSDFGYMDKALQPYIQQAIDNYSDPRAMALARENAQRDLVNTGPFGLPGAGKSRDWQNLMNAYQLTLDALGGVDEVTQKLVDAEASGSAEAANQYRNLLAGYQLLSGNESQAYGVTQAVQAEAAATPSDYSIESARSLIEGPTFDKGAWESFIDTLEHPNDTTVSPMERYDWMSEATKQAMNSAVAGLNSAFDLDKVLADRMPEGADFGKYGQQWAAWQLMNMPTAEAERYRNPDRAELVNLQTQLTAKQSELDSLNRRIAAAEAPTNVNGNVSYSQEGGNRAPDESYQQRASLEGEIAAIQSSIAALTSATAAAAAQSAAQTPQTSPQSSETALNLNTEGATAAKAEVDAVFGEGVEVSVTFPDTGSNAGAARSEVESTLSPDVNVGVSFPGAVSTAASTHSAIKAQFPPITQVVNIVTRGGGGGGVNVRTKMAEGGRATEPAIFAEAGKPEWFIPEENTPRTASLIVQAAEASGFSLADLADMTGAKLFANGGVLGGQEFSVASMANDPIPSLVWDDLTPASSSESGGGGSDGGTSGIQVEYSPVIHADNAEGVERVLKQDKERLRAMLQEMLEERELMESVSAYK